MINNIFLFFNFLINIILLVGVILVYILIKKELDIKLKEKEIKEAQESISALEKLSNLFQELRKELETKLENTQKEIQEKLEKSVEKTAKIEEVARVLESH